MNVPVEKKFLCAGNPETLVVSDNFAIAKAYFLEIPSFLFRHVCFFSSLENMAQEK